MGLSRLSATPLLDRMTCFPLSGKMVIVFLDSDPILAFLFEKILSSLDPLVLSRIRTVESASRLMSSSSSWRFGSLTEKKSFIIADCGVLSFCFLLCSNADFPSSPISVLNAQRILDRFLFFFRVRKTPLSMQSLSFFVLINRSSFPFASDHLSGILYVYVTDFTKLRAFFAF